MDKHTHEIRLAHWRQSVEQWQSRPKSQTAKQWLAELFLRYHNNRNSPLHRFRTAKSPTPTSSGGLPEAPQGAFDTCAPERRVSQALLLATAKKRLLHYLLFLTLLTVLQCTS